MNNAACTKLRKLCKSPHSVCFTVDPFEKIQSMKQASLTLNLHAKKTRKQVFLEQMDQVEKIKASIRAKVEHPFRVIKRQFDYVKVRYRGLKKNTAQLFALSNLWMMRGKLMLMQG